MADDAGISRRVFLAPAAGLTLTVGAAGTWQPEASAGRGSPYAVGAWLAGDHHIHTKYSYDGMYEIDEQVAQAARFGLSWCVITDHGGVHHDRVALGQAYPELVAARARHPGVLVFQGLEWNVPSAAHCSVIVPPTRDEA